MNTRRRDKSKPKRAPLCKFGLMRSLPASVVTPGWPMMPSLTAGPVVTSGGAWKPLVHHIRYSALSRMRF